MYFRTGCLSILQSNLFKRHASSTQQYAGLQEGSVHAVKENF